MHRAVAVVFLLGGVACGSAGRPDPVILLSIDGFRYDYLARGLTPHLSALVAEGVTAPLVPSFPTKTFPNHYTIVTGQYPGQHGIVANNIWDAAIGDTFALGNRDAVRDARWWGGEPVWVTAAEAGLASAIMFWPGSEAPLGGRRPARWMTYDHEFPHDARVDSVLAWLALPGADRPAFVAWYLAVVDDAGHRHGPDAPQTDSAIVEADRVVGRLVEGLRARGQLDRVRLVIVSDHGMAPTSRNRTVALDDYVDLDGLWLLDWSPFLQVWGDPARLVSVMPRLRAVPHLTVWWKDSLPQAWHYRDHPRTAPIVGLVDDGWTLTTRARLATEPERFDGGNHGFADTLESMRALFVARGPGIRRGVVGPPFRNIHVYPFLMRLLRLDPAPHAGSLDSVARFLP